jgi:hypothetical protein
MLVKLQTRTNKIHVILNTCILDYIEGLSVSYFIGSGTTALVIPVYFNLLAAI